MEYPTVSFDESGNTGCDFLNNTQKYFVLVSSDFSINEAEILLKPLRSKQNIQTEIKFTNLVKKKNNYKKIINFLKKALQDKNRVKATLYHKDLYLCTLLADYIDEYIAYEKGKDFYENKNNINIALLHYENLQRNKEYSNAFKKSFVKMIKLVGFIEQRKDWIETPSSTTDVNKLKNQLNKAYLERNYSPLNSI